MWFKINAKCFKEDIRAAPRRAPHRPPAWATPPHKQIKPAPLVVKMGGRTRGATNRYRHTPADPSIAAQLSNLLTFNCHTWSMHTGAKRSRAVGGFVPRQICPRLPARGRRDSRASPVSRGQISIGRPVAPHLLPKRPSAFWATKPMNVAQQPPSDGFEVAPH